MKGKKLLIFGILSISIIAVIIVSCSMMAPDPEFTITYFSPSAFYISAATSNLVMDTIRIINNCPLELKISQMYYEYLRNTTVLHTSENQSFSVYIPALTQEMDTLGDSSYVELYNYIADFPTDVYNSMVNNDWENITLRLYITIEDNHGYNKTLTKSIDVPVIQR